MNTLSQVAQSPQFRAPQESRTPVPSFNPTAAKLVSDDLDPKLREKVLTDLSKFPDGALNKLSSEGWKVHFTDTKTRDDRKEGGSCNPVTKRITLDRETYSKDVDGKILLHEGGHALDLKGFAAPKGLMGRMLTKMGVPMGDTVYKSHEDPKMQTVYQNFQAQNLVSFANRVAHQRNGDVQGFQEGDSTSGKAPFHGNFSIGQYDGQLMVKIDAATSADQAAGTGTVTHKAPTTIQGLNVQGVDLKSLRNDENNVVVVAAEDAAKLSTDWTSNADYVGTSNFPTELYAEGVAAYLATPDSRAALQTQSPDVYSYIHNSMNEYLIADNTR